MSHVVPTASAADRAALVALFAKTLFAASTRLLTSPFKGENGHPKYFVDVVFAATRTLLEGMTLSQTRLIKKSSAEAYFDFTKAKKLMSESIDLPNDVQAHWLGDPKAATTIVYFHGGGYAVPASENHFNYLYDLITVMKHAGASVSCLVLAYTLAPEAEYPTQLSEAATLIHHLIETEKRSPSSLILGGDSAGGNLLLSLLSHILHPHPNPLVPRLTLTEPFHAAFAISPWVSFATDHASYAKNAHNDMFTKAPLNTWAQAFLGSPKTQGLITGDSYSEPFRAEPTWWNAASRIVSEMLIWGGGGELFIDGIKAFADKFVQGWVSGGGDGKLVTLVVTPRMAHEEMIFDMLLGYAPQKKGEAALVIEHWIKTQLSCC